MTRLCITFVADYSSPIARRWISNIAAADVTVHVVSTRAFQRDLLDPTVASIVTVGPPLEGTLRWVVDRLRRRRGAEASSASAAPTLGYLRVLPLLILLNRRRLRRALGRHPTDLVHALRIPIEAMAAAHALKRQVPLVVSVWGNDLTLYAAGSRMFGRLTRGTLAVADGLLADCDRDRRLAREWGFNHPAPAEVIPGNGGVDAAVFFPAKPDGVVLRRLGLEQIRGPVVFNPRGLRRYVRTAEFLAAIPAVVRDHPEAHFVLAGVKGSVAAERALTDAGVGGSVTLLPTLTEDEMATLFRRAVISASPSVHDGTPNSLLEAMAMGCFPVAGRLPSVEEWVDHGVNGLLFNSNDAQDIAAKINTALDDIALQDRARRINFELIKNRAAQPTCRADALSFYRSVLRE